MSRTYEAVKLSDGFYWVGAVDWDIRDFHGYSTGRGTTYNSYLLAGRRNILFDGVKEQFHGEMMERVASVVDPSTIDTVVSNHSEMDHSGSLPALLGQISPKAVYASPAGVKNLSLQMPVGGSVRAVSDGERIDIGGEDLLFIETRMLHWPDSMFSYLPSRKILVSQDAFGMHLATRRLFADENDESVLEYEAARYYANILLPYSSLVSKLIGRVAGLGLELGLVAPDHGPAWRECATTGPGWIAGLYSRWAAQKPGRKVLVVYDTMWHATERMARAVAEGAASAGAETLVMNARGSHRSDIAFHILDAGALALGSPTLNNGLFPTIADVSTYLKGLRRTGLVGGAFGSYGWSGESVKQLVEVLSDMKVEVLGSVSSQFGPDAAGLSSCRDLGTALASRLSAVESDESAG
jgi:flavorubredoxin